MSNFPEKDSQKLGQAFDRSNFTQTCNLFSQFLKEKTNSGNFSLGMAGKSEPRGNPASTLDLLTIMANPENASAVENLPQFVENACIKRSDSRSPESATPQLTIFYSGKVLIFDAFPAEKATEIMELATKLSSDSSSATKQIPPFAFGAAEKLNVFKAPQTNSASEAPRPGPQAVGSDMRYPRRSSLVKFFEKRKERVIARGPYQLNNPNPNPKNEEGSSGGDPEDQSSKHLDLNL